MSDFSTLNDSADPSERPFGATEYDQLPTRVWWLGALMVLIGIVTFTLMATNGQSEGYFYLFFYSIPANTAISVFPHEPVLIWYGTIANMWIAGLVATGGTMVAGWLDHRVFVPVLNYTKITSYKKSHFYTKMTSIFMRYPFATIVVTGLTPIPFWPFKFLCFSIHYPVWRYLAALAAGRFPRYVFLAWVGAVFEVPAWILILTVVIIFGVYAIRGIPAGWQWLKNRRQTRQQERAPVSATEAE